MVQAIGKRKNMKMNCIPNNVEKYIFLSIDNFDIMESLQFMNASFDKFRPIFPHCLCQGIILTPGRELKQLPLMELKFESCFDSYIGVKLTPTNELLFILLDVVLS